MATGASRSLCSATILVSAAHIIEMRPTQSVLCRSGGGCVLLPRCGKRDFLSIRVRKSCEINAITFSQRSARSNLSRLSCVHCVLVTLSTSEVRLPWTLEEKHRHEVNGHAGMTNVVKSA